MNGKFRSRKYHLTLAGLFAVTLLGAFGRIDSGGIVTGIIGVLTSYNVANVLQKRGDSTTNSA